MIRHATRSDCDSIGRECLVETRRLKESIERLERTCHVRASTLKMWMAVAIEAWPQFVRDYRRVQQASEVADGGDGDTDKRQIARFISASQGNRELDRATVLEVMTTLLQQLTRDCDCDCDAATTTARPQIAHIRCAANVRDCAAPMSPALRSSRRASASTSTSRLSFRPPTPSPASPTSRPAETLVRTPLLSFHPSSISGPSTLRSAGTSSPLLSPLSLSFRRLLRSAAASLSPPSLPLSSPANPFSAPPGTVSSFRLDTQVIVPADDPVRRGRGALETPRTSSPPDKRRAIFRRAHETAPPPVAPPLSPPTVSKPAPQSLTPSPITSAHSSEASNRAASLAPGVVHVQKLDRTHAEARYNEYVRTRLLGHVHKACRVGEECEECRTSGGRCRYAIKVSDLSDDVSGDVEAAAYRDVFFLNYLAAKRVDGQRIVPIIYDAWIGARAGGSSLGVLRHCRYFYIVMERFDGDMAHLASSRALAATPPRSPPPSSPLRAERKTCADRSAQASTKVRPEVSNGARAVMSAIYTVDELTRMFRIAAQMGVLNDNIRPDQYLYRAATESDAKDAITIVITDFGFAGRGDAARRRALWGWPGGAPTAFSILKGDPAYTNVLILEQSLFASHPVGVRLTGVAMCGHVRSRFGGVRDLDRALPENVCAGYTNEVVRALTRAESPTNVYTLQWRDLTR